MEKLKLKKHFNALLNEYVESDGTEVKKILIIFSSLCKYLNMCHYETHFAVLWYFSLFSYFIYLNFSCEKNWRYFNEEYLDEQIVVLFKAWTVSFANVCSSYVV